MPDISQCAACNYYCYYRTSQLTQPYDIPMQSKSLSPMCGKSPLYSYQLDVEHLRASVSQVATRWRRNAATFPCLQSQWPSFPSPSVGVAQAWSHCWTYLLDEGGRTIGERGGSKGEGHK